ncbi:MAG: hypothetical protein U9Q79_03885 [Candidatus Hydrogenedentes bacterium]|nr:hypothetical protein [Candidatus Hydrogenedentota bacterium]
MTLLIDFPCAQNDGGAKTPWPFSEHFGYWEQQVAAASCRWIHSAGSVPLPQFNSAAGCRRYFCRFFWATTD